MPALTIASKLERFPPVLCRLLARTKQPGRRGGVRALTAAEIATRARLPVAYVEVLSTATSWDHVPVQVMLTFSAACGVDFNSRADLRAQDSLMRRTTSLPPYLLASPEWPATLRHVAELYAQSIQSHTPTR